MSLRSAWARLSAVCAVLLLLCLTPTFAAAQVAGTAALTGAVTDPSGAIVVGADLTATNLASGAKRSTKTDSAGKYLFSQLPPGDYRVDVTAAGFKTAARPRVELPVGVTSTLDILLDLGDLAEVVEVQAVTAAVNTNDASMGTPLTGAEIRSLPSLDLNPAGLLSLQAGVAFIPSAADTPGGYGGVSDYRRSQRRGQRRAQRPDQHHPGWRGLQRPDQRLCLQLRSSRDAGLTGRVPHDNHQLRCRGWRPLGSGAGAVDHHVRREHAAWQRLLRPSQRGVQRQRFLPQQERRQGTALPPAHFRRRAGRAAGEEPDVPVRQLGADGGKPVQVGRAFRSQLVVP